MDVCVYKNGVTGRAWCRNRASFTRSLSGPVNRWGERGLHPSGEASAHPVLPSLLSQLSAGVTVTSLNTSSWWRCGWRVATGLTQCPGCLHSACCTLACKAVSLCLQCYNKVRCREERNRGNQHWDPFFSHHFFPSVLYFCIPLIHSPPTHQCESLSYQRGAAFQLDFFSAQLQIREAVIFFTLLFELCKATSSLHSIHLIYSH